MINKIKEYQKIILNRLNELKKIWEKSGTLSDSMNYTLLNSGKLARSILILIGLNDLKIDINIGIDVACSLEMIQSYSLIHDDLPEMDNATTRRNKLSNHLVYSHPTALLAGDALLTDSFYVLASCNLESSLKIELIKLFASKAGSNGVCFGQNLDIINEKKPFIKWEDIENIIYNKTCALFNLSFSSIGIIANLDKNKKDKLSELGYLVGLAFQIQDDLFDTFGSKEELGKDASQDINKNTYHKLFGKDAAIKKINELKKQSNILLEEVFGKNNEISKYLNLLIK